MNTASKKQNIRRLLALLLSLLMTFSFLMPFSVRAEEQKDDQQVIRVGWYDSPFNQMDPDGRRSGYAYEYQRKIAAYTGWTYEYVEGTWPELLEKLENGEIDLMSDISYKDERAEKILYASLPMGTESYYVFTSTGNTDISSDDPSSLNGKKVGVTKDSVQEGILRSWAISNTVKIDIVEMDGSENDSIEAMLRGELDAYLTLDAYGDPEHLVPVFKIGSSDFYFAVSRKRPELLSQLNSAMSRIQDENNYYNQEMYRKYLKNSSTSRYLTSDEKRWLEKHGTIRIGYQDNYLAFCAKDSSGELTGALKDYLAFAAGNIANSEITFEPKAYATASEAMDALKNGEIDCMFPSNLTDYDGEAMDLVLTQPLMRTEMLAVVRAEDQQSFLRKDPVTVAVNEGNPNYEIFLADHFPKWSIVHYEDTPACLKAVAASKADCILISNYRFTNLEKQCEDMNLTTITTGVDMPYCFAVREGNTELYSILTRLTNVVPESTVSAYLNYYSTEDAKSSFLDFIKEHLALFMGIAAVIFLVIIFLLLRSIHAEKKAAEEQHLIEDLNKRVNYDALTSVRNKGAFTGYIKDIQERINKDEEVEFAVCILDCNNLKEVNDRYGHEKGDEYLKTSCRLICQTFRHSAVFRIGGDEFAVVMMNEDYTNRDELVRKFEEAQTSTNTESSHMWDQVHVALGIAVYDPKTDRSTANITVRRADKIMYENKRIWKEEHQTKSRRK